MEYDKDYANWKVGDKVINNMTFVEKLKEIPSGTLLTIYSIAYPMPMSGDRREDMIVVMDSLGNKLATRKKWKFNRVVPVPEINPQLSFDF